MKKVQDHYFHKARREGFAARSVYKLEEIDRRHKLLAPRQLVLDLGCAPGSWLAYAARRVAPKGRVVGVDLHGVDAPLPFNARVVAGDAFCLPPATLLDGEPAFDVILSDMALGTTGIKSADAERSAELVLRTLALAAALLRPGGSLLAKVYQGARLAELRGAFRRSFATVSVEKPKASRAESVEVFLLGRQFGP